GPATNAWTARLLPSLPLTFHAGGFRWAGRDYDGRGDAIHLVYPSPPDPTRFLLLIAGNSAAALRGEGGEPLFGSADWRIYRDGVLRRSGSFAQDGGRPWRYEPALDRDRDDEERRFRAGLHAQGAPGVVVRAAVGASAVGPVLEAASRLLGRLDRIGLRGATPVAITLYRSLEEKGTIVGDTRPEQRRGAAVDLALATGRAEPDLSVIVEARLV